MSFISYSAFYAPANVVCICVYVCLCVCVSEPPIWLWPAGCCEHGEGGRALETSSLAAWVCGGGPHPCEKVSDQPHCERDLRFESGLPLDSSAFIALYLFLSQLSRLGSSHTDSLTHTHTHTHTHTLMGVIFFIAPLLVSLFFLKPPLSSLLLTASLYSPPVSSSQNYSSRLRADVCVRERRLLRQAPAARCLCGACRGPCYHHSRASRRPFHYARVPFRHRVAAAGKQVTKSNAQSRTGCVES